MEHLEEENVTPEADEAEENSQPQSKESDEDADFEKERYNQIVSWKQKQIDNLRQIAVNSAVESAKYNANSLIDLHNTDPKLANEVAKKFGYDDYKEAEREIKKLSWDSLTKKDDDNEDFDTKYAKRRNQEKHDDAMKKAEKAISKLDDELQDKAQSYLEKITKGQNLDIDSIEEYIDMVTLYVTRDKVDAKKTEKAKESFHSTTVSKSSKWSTNDDEWEYIAWGKILSSK